jgi:excinuclease ABC subunit B
MPLKFDLHTPFKLTGDQPEAVDGLVNCAAKGERSTLLGVTGSGKTASIAFAMAKLNKPTIVISHNKTLAAQLYGEFKEFFPHNRVEYFVSYYDYYQPESYLPQSDTYIEKETQVNERIEAMRLSATASVLSGEPCVVVASVSCIYGLGSPADFTSLSVRLAAGQPTSRRQLIEELLVAQYGRNDTAPTPGCFRVRGDTIDIFPGYTTTFVRVELEDGKIARMNEFDALTVKRLRPVERTTIFPAKHFVVPQDRIKRACASIERELGARLPELGDLEAHRLKTRVEYDVERIAELGYCNGIENYSRHFDGRKVGEAPYCLLDFFPPDSLLVIDESHVTLPQIHGMREGDKTRKRSLVDYGFRLPSAYDNRPLSFEEFELNFLKTRPAIFVSATPGDYERNNSAKIVQQLVRPTGVVDPPIILRPTEGQAQDLRREIENTTKLGLRTLVTTLTKRMAEDLTDYLVQNGIKARYLHSEIDTLERSEIIRQLRLGKFDCIVGINLLREGLDIPEVALVCIMDADKPGFLRNTTSLIQTIGRGARNAQGRVIFYCDGSTPAMKEAIGETERRRNYQLAYNKKHGITPKTIVKKIAEAEGDVSESVDAKSIPRAGLHDAIVEAEEAMQRAAEGLDFERAIKLRERVKQLRKRAAEISA